MGLAIALLTIGNELLSGDRQDTHTQRIANFLTPRGYRLQSSVSVPDDENLIAEALTYLGEKNHVVVVTGGLGGTSDDLTARAAAKAFRRRLSLNEEALSQVRDRLRSMGREPQAYHEKMALFPQKAGPLGNPAGVAPGFQIRWQETEFLFFPGVPAELEAMLLGALLPRLQTLHPGEPIEERRLQIFGLPESQVEQKLEGADLPSEVEVGFRVHHPFVTVKLTARGGDAMYQADLAEAEALKALGDRVYGRGDARLQQVVADLLLGHELTLALAESCTGGMIASQLTDIPGASAFLDRSGVVYANRAKRSWLGVPDDILRSPGAVSKECAQAMAVGIRRTAQTDLGLAVTGIAGPGGGTTRKPVGTVFLSLATPDGVRTKEYQFKGDREKVRAMSVATGLDWIRRYVLSRQCDL